ncbi:MAG: hypothetical protein ACXIUW_18315, partial [Roseinatronobacter sp.]
IHCLEISKSKPDKPARTQPATSPPPVKRYLGNTNITRKRKITPKLRKLKKRAAHLIRGYAPESETGLVFLGLRRFLTPRATLICDWKQRAVLA